jgi:hypothetical protein
MTTTISRPPGLKVGVLRPLTPDAGNRDAIAALRQQLRLPPSSAEKIAIVMIVARIPRFILILSAPVIEITRLIDLLIPRHLLARIFLRTKERPEKGSALDDVIVEMLDDRPSAANERSPPLYTLITPDLSGS